jgi:hypothetical protein
MRVLGGTLIGTGSLNLWMRFTDHVKGEDSFSQHSNIQHRAHWISGMHKPYIPNASQRELITQHFSQFQHLIPFSPEDVEKQCNLKSPVHLRFLADCPLKDLSKVASGDTVVVGGPPALISTAFEPNVTYINDGRRPPIAWGSAFHLEWDAKSEEPTSSQPVYFMIDQLKRLAFPEFLATAQRTGQFPWKSLDWVSWIKNPSKWLVGTRVAIAFQRFTQSGPHPEVVEEVVTRTKKNESFYESLDQELDQQLLMSGKGSAYVARDSDEQENLLSMQKSLSKEHRAFPFLSEKEIVEEFGYRPQGVAFAKKIHDRTLSPHFLKVLSERTLNKGGRVIDGRVTRIYTDDPNKGGIIEYQTNNKNETHYLRFRRLVMSLGTQQVLGVDDVPLFDIVAARGVSAIALARLSKEAVLPPTVVCGGTNHVTKLAGPVPFEGKNLFLLRMTCGACITPTSDSADYDATAALGLRTAVSTVLKDKVEILTAYGCNRQVSQYGQTHWLQVPVTLKTASRGLTPRGEKEDIGSSLPTHSSGIFIQYGAGGGGLTQAPAQK